MRAEELISRLDKARQNGRGRWMAVCPAHADRSPSLSIHETSDGRILLHCFGGCDTGEVLGALGLSMTDLFDEPLAHHMPRGATQRYITGATMQELVQQAQIVFSIATVMNDFGECGTDDRKKLMDATATMRNLLESTGGKFTWK